MELIRSVPVLKSPSSSLLISRYILRLGQVVQMYLEIRYAGKGTFRPSVICSMMSCIIRLFDQFQATTHIENEHQRRLNLRLADLGWSEVPLKMVDWAQVASIDLSSNPLECDCKLLRVKDLLSDLEIKNDNDTDAVFSENSNNPNQVYCQYPYNLKDRPLQVNETFNEFRLNF